MPAGSQKSSSAVSPRSSAVSSRPAAPADVQTIAKGNIPAKTGTRSKQTNIPLNGSFADALKQFSFQSASIILSDNKSGINRICSPLSLFIAMAITADGTRGETQSQILNALSMGKLGMLPVRNQTGILLKNLYLNDGESQIRPANSLWLQKGVSYKADFFKSAAANYYADSFSIDFSKQSAASKQIGKWISDNTGGLLGSQYKVEPGTILSIINTLYFYDKWNQPFNAGCTMNGRFYLANGSAVNCSYMNDHFYGNYLKLDHCTVSELPFVHKGNMVFILPDKGFTPYDIIKDPAVFQKIAGSFCNGKGTYGDKTTEKEVRYSLPKFKFGGDLQLKDNLKKMGIRKAFTGGDFSNMSSEISRIGKVEQQARIEVDENGCKGAAYTEVTCMKSLTKVEGETMTLNRPFIFAILNSDETLLFTGIVNDPTKNS